MTHGQLLGLFYHVFYIQIVNPVCMSRQLIFILTLPDDKISALTKFKAFADDKIIVTQKLKIVLGRVESIVGKGENAGYQHFLLFPHCFSKAFFSRGVKSRDRVVIG